MVKKRIQDVLKEVQPITRNPMGELESGFVPIAFGGEAANIRPIITVSITVTVEGYSCGCGCGCSC